MTTSSFSGPPPGAARRRRCPRPARPAAPIPGAGKRSAGRPAPPADPRTPARVPPTTAPPGRRTGPAAPRPAGTPTAARRSPRRAAARPAPPAGPRPARPPGPARALGAGQQPGDGGDGRAVDAGREPLPPDRAVRGRPGAQPHAVRRVQQGRRLGQRGLPAGVQHQSVPRGRADQVGRGALRRGGRPLPLLGRPVLLGRGVDQPGQTVGEALLGEGAALQTDQHPDGLLLVLPDRLADRVLEHEDVPLGDGVPHRVLRAGHALAAQRLGERGRLQHRVPGRGGLLQQPDGQRTAPPLVVGPGLPAEQRAGEPVRLLGADARHPQKLPRILPQQVRGVLAQGGGGRRGERGGRTAPRQDLPHLAHGALGGRGRSLRDHRGPPHRLGRGAPRRGPRLLEHGGRRLLAALHGPDGGEQVGRRAAQLGAGLDRALPLRLAPLDPLPLQALRGQLRLGLGHLRALGGRAVVRAPRLLRGLRRAHSVLQS